MSNYSGMDREAREALKKYDELRAYLQNEWTTELADEALDLADFLADTLENILDGKVI